MGKGRTSGLVTGAVITLAALGLTLAAPLENASAAIRVETATITLSKSSGPPGTSVMVRGTGFARNTMVRILFTDFARHKTVLATKIPTGATGSFAQTVAVPMSAPKGEGHFSAADKLASQKATAPFRVT